ncbi:hypothetical protein KIW84_054776 [Lathyrus oleraceus]|uniref:Uncharacterized protein n=1 Tax=Pisum sativum TaxID=3888 RepID=A0A9D5AHW1_PEA|nr:hypothetical protein KIW84_054776 [Pisum sativum]
MSISGLISELRDSFLKKDFDRVEEALIVREARLRAEIEEKKREIRLLNEEIDFQRIEKMSVELELKRVKELIDRGDIACAVAERGNVGVSAASGNWWTNSSRVVSKNFTTKLAEPAGVLKRDFASSAGYVSNVLDGLDTDSSSSSSSSSSGEFDISSFTSLKRTKLS